MKPIFIAASAALVLGAGYLTWPRSKVQDGVGQAGSVLADVTLPTSLSPGAEIGKTVFEAKCAACHGPNAAGQAGVAPPLVHVIYEPGHHGDESFQRAAAKGVGAHHWRFGNMPPVEGVTRGDVEMIVIYIRELQQANGIY